VADSRALLDHCLAQSADTSIPVTERITAANIARQYLEALTRELVEEAREGGHSWEDLATVLRTSPANVRARFGSYRDYDD
jgi:AraC-like DNA-binding protein